MITTVIPDNWQQLQIEVGRILEECGFRVEVEKKVQTVRGQVELDIYAEERVDDRKYSIICECKYWKSRVPQTVIHGFRTVMADIGANVGYVVSLAGFQEGAFKTSEMTNVELVTWEEFQAAFEKTWFGKYLSPLIAERLDPLLTYAEPILPKWFSDLSEEHQQRYLALKDRYDEFGWLIMTFTPYARWHRDENIPTLPIIDRLPANSRLVAKVPAGILAEVGYRQFFDATVEYGEHAIQEFRALRDTPP